MKWILIYKIITHWISSWLCLLRDSKSIWNLNFIYCYLHKNVCVSPYHWVNTFLLRWIPLIIWEKLDDGNIKKKISYLQISPSILILFYPVYVFNALQYTIITYIFSRPNLRSLVALEASAVFSETKSIHYDVNDNQSIWQWSHVKWHF